MGSFSLPEEIKSTDDLTKGDGDLLSDVLLGGREDDGITNFQPRIISMNFSINNRRLASLSVSIVRTNSVDLNVSALSVEELLVDVRALSADLVHIRIEFAASILCLSKQALASSPS
jgi:hypothetical protein